VLTLKGARKLSIFLSWKFTTSILRAELPFLTEEQIKDLMLMAFESASLPNYTAQG